MNATNYLEKSLLNHLFGGPDYVRPARLWLALFSANPVGADEVLVAGVELSGSGYARTAFDNNSTMFAELDPDDDVVASEKASALGVQFQAATANWVPVTHWGLFDAETNGNLLVYGALTDSITILLNQALKVEAGSLTLTMD